MQTLSGSRVLVSYSFGSSLGGGEGMAILGRQLAEEFSEYCALLPGFISVPQIIVHEGTGEDPVYSAGKDSRAYAVFYSLPETSWMLRSTRLLGGDYCLTGRISVSDGVWILGLNVLDVHSGHIVFCRTERFFREALCACLQGVGERLMIQLGEVDDVGRLDLSNSLRKMRGTESFGAFMNWARVRDYERGLFLHSGDSVRDKVVEHCIFGLQSDPGYRRCTLRLMSVLYESRNVEAMARVISGLHDLSLSDSYLGSLVAWCYYRTGRLAECSLHLSELVKRYGDCSFVRSGLEVIGGEAVSDYSGVSESSLLFWS